MSEQADLIRSWLMKRPKPSSVRVTTVAGEVHDYEVPTVRPRWRNIAEDLEQFEPKFLEALGAEEQTLRPLRLKAEAVAAAPSRREVSVPDALQGDPQAALMSHFANLLSQAYAHSTDVAFDKLLALVERMDRRQDSLEQRLERSERRLEDEIYDRLEDMMDAAEEQVAAKAAGEGGDTRSAMDSVFGQILAQGGRGPGKPNGKRKRSS